jgi:acetyltransferase-like isoleucine patch superfamily enzyme
MSDQLSKFLNYLVKSSGRLCDIAVNFQYSTAATLGSGSKFYRQSSVVNMQNDKSKIKTGSNTHIRGELLIFPYGGEIKIGSGAYIGEGTKLWSGEKITIGNHVGIAHNVNITDFAHETDYLERAAGVERIFTQGHPKEKGSIPTAPIIIEDYVAIYPNAIISRGVTIGQGSIISAGSVILSDVPPFTLMLGNPARPMKNLK